jgi:hypothetical protein
VSRRTSCIGDERSRARPSSKSCCAIDRRGSAADAARLYRETSASVAAREQEEMSRRQAIAMQPRFAGRPTKRERRKLEDFLNEP